MGYPYSWQNNTNAGIKGPTPMAVEIKTGDNTEDEKTEVFYSGFGENDYKSLIRSSLQRILMTNKGERVMLPEFGCDLNKYIFEPADSFLEAEIKNEILTAIQKWEPRVTVKSISMKFENGNALVIAIPYTINGTDTSDTVNYVIKSKNLAVGNI